MPIKAIYDMLEEVPEKYRDLYTEQGEKWELTGVDGVKTQADIDRINAVRQKETTARKEAEKALRAFSGVDADGLQDKLDELDRLRITGGTVDSGKIEEMVAQRVELDRKKHARDLEKIRGELDSATGQIAEYKERTTRAKIDGELTKACDAAGIRPEAREDVLLRRGNFSVTEEGVVVTQEADGVKPGLSPSDWLAGQVEARPHWVAPNTPSGARSGAAVPPAGPASGSQFGVPE